MEHIAAQYRTISAGTGWADLSQRGRLRFDGPDAVSFLQALLTNDLSALQAGQGLYSAYLSPNGRMIADLELYHRGEYILASVAAGTAPALAARFDQLIFSEDLRVRDATADLYEVVVIGKTAVDALARALALEAGMLDALPEYSQLEWADGLVTRSAGLLLPAYKLFGPVGGMARIADVLGSAGIAAVGVQIVDALRILEGRPAWGFDLTDDVIPLEAGLLDRAISTTKGCYVGQEIIIRMLHRGGGRVAKRLVMLEFPRMDGPVPARGTPLLVGVGTEAGRLTSVAHDPASDRLVALGYLRSEHAQVGTPVTLAGSSTAGAVVGFAH